MDSENQTLTRALRLLEAFEGDCRPRSHAELKRQTGYSKASVSRLLAILSGLGYVSRSADGVTYQLGMACLRLGSSYLQVSPLHSAARPILQHYADKHDLSVALGVRHGLHAVYVCYCKSERVAALSLGVGTILPLETTAMGRLLLWAQPLGMRESLLFELVRRSGPNASEVVHGIQGAFQSLDRDGWYAAHGEYQRDALGVGVPVELGFPPVTLGLTFGEIALSVDQSRLRRNIVPSLMQAREELQIALRDISSELF